MLPSKGIMEVFEIYQSGMGYKAMSKSLGLQQTTLRTIISKGHTQLPPSITHPGRPRRLSKKLQDSLDSDNDRIHDSTNRNRAMVQYQ